MMPLSSSTTGPAPLVRSARAILLIWIVILACSLILYDALLVSSLRKELWINAQASTRVAVNSLHNKIALGVRFGKKLGTYQGLSKLLDDMHGATGIPLAVLDAHGKILHARGEIPPLTAVDGFTDGGDGIRLQEDKTGATLLAPVLQRNGSVAGYIGARVLRAPVDRELYSLLLDQVKGQGLIALAGILVLLGLLRVIKTGKIGRLPCRISPERRERFTRAACFCVFLLVMLADGCLVLHSVGTRHTRALEADAERAGALLSGDLKRLLLVGVSLDRTDRVDAYLESVAAAHGNAIVLDILTPTGERFAGSAAPDIERLPGGRSFPLLDEAATPHGSSWNLRVSIARGPWMDRLFVAGMDILTLVIIALIFMVELFLLIARGMEARADGLTHARRSGLFRPLMFVFVLAMDMSVSFIPLRVAELVSSDQLTRELLSGLPISAEMGMTGLSVLIAGAWMKRRGPRPPLLTGILCMALGYVGSMLAQTPWQFIAARAGVGLGYGLSLLTAQAHTVKDGKLADMFAGVYAGSLCGSALGAMLAERMGYAPVFLVSACILACLAVAPLALLQRGREEAETAVPAVRPNFVQSLPQIRRLLGDRRFLSFVLLALVPSAMLCVGFLNYFLPVYLKSAGVAQSNIGRVYMLNCLIVIYSGPPLTALVMKSAHKAHMVFWAGVLSALSLLSFALLPSLPASVLGSVLLGLATGLNIPAYSEYLLQLDIARAVGVDQTMSLFDALQRVGQVLGPLCVGAGLAAMSVDSAALWGGLGFGVISLLFLPLAGRRTVRTEEQ